MNTLFIALALLLFTSTAYAQRDRYEVTPKYRSRYVQPDGRSNSYIIRDRYGRRVGEARVKHYDSRIDGVNDPGSKTNPYIIKRKERTR